MAFVKGNIFYCKPGGFPVLLGEKLLAELELVSFNADRAILFLVAGFAFFIVNCVRIRFLSLLS